MGNRLSKIYTRTGDKGETGLGDGSMWAKTPRAWRAYGTVDELNSSLGVLLTEDGPALCANALTEVQHHLFDLGSELCVPGYAVLTDAHIDWLEAVLDALNESLPPLKEFILPGGSRAAALCHVARTQCRRAEREVVALGRRPSCRRAQHATSTGCQIYCSSWRGTMRATKTAKKCSGSVSETCRSVEAMQQRRRKRTRLATH